MKENFTYYRIKGKDHKPIEAPQQSIFDVIRTENVKLLESGLNTTELIYVDGIYNFKQAEFNEWNMTNDEFFNSFPDAVEFDRFVKKI